MQIGQQTWYITNIQAVDPNTDRLALSLQMPASGVAAVAFGSLTQDVAKPHDYKTGDAVTVTLETVTAP